jgi:hypothetical protein
MVNPRLIRATLALGLAALIAYGLSASLSWDEWQPIGWCVILGGGFLAITTPGGSARAATWAAAMPALTFFAGYTFFYWELTTWQVVDAASICCFLAAAYLSTQD